MRVKIQDLCYMRSSSPLHKGGTKGGIYIVALRFSSPVVQYSQKETMDEQKKRLTETVHGAG